MLPFASVESSSSSNSVMGAPLAKLVRACYSSEYVFVLMQRTWTKPGSSESLAHVFLSPSPVCSATKFCRRGSDLTSINECTPCVEFPNTDAE